MVDRSPLGQNRPSSSSSRPAGAANSERRARPVMSALRRAARRRRRRRPAPRHPRRPRDTDPRLPQPHSRLYSDLSNAIGVKFDPFRVFINQVHDLSTATRAVRCSSIAGPPRMLKSAHDVFASIVVQRSAADRGAAEPPVCGLARAPRGRAAAPRPHQTRAAAHSSTAPRAPAQRDKVSPGPEPARGPCYLQHRTTRSHYARPRTPSAADDASHSI